MKIVDPYKIKIKLKIHNTDAVAQIEAKML